MRIVFMGTPEFAVPSLKILIESEHDVVAVITSTDKLGGRGKKQLLVSAVKKYAESSQIPVLQPKNLKDTSFIEELRSYAADLQVVVAFRMLPVVVWNMPSKGTMNLHGSLLPKFRGAAPINWAVINGEKETGVTTFLLQHEIDTGDILAQSRFPIRHGDTAGSVHDKMMDIGALLVLESVNKIASGDFKLQSQNEDEVSKAPKIHHEDCEINFDHSGKKVYNFIRGLAPYPGAFTHIDGKEVKIIGCALNTERRDLKPNEIWTDEKTKILVGTQDFSIEITELKMAGKRKLFVQDFLNGYQIQNQEIK